MAPLGAGAVAIFDEDGNFIKELVVGSRLAAPWDITFAPPGFRRFSNHLLVGNFSYLHSEINAFDPTNGNLHGTIPIQTGGHPASGLWALDFGVGGNNGSPDVLYFTDGINGEAIDGKPLRSCRPCCHSATAQGTTFLAGESERGGRREGDGVAVAALVVAARRLK